MIPKTLVEKMPPQNKEAEVAVLGSMLLDREAIAKAIESLRKERVLFGIPPGNIRLHNKAL